MMTAAAAAIMYTSVEGAASGSGTTKGEAVGAVVGEIVGAVVGATLCEAVGADSMPMPVDADELQYELLPSNVAKIL